MGVARRMTRGNGERTQVKELRSSQFPQNGLYDEITPSSVNTTVDGTNIVAIRTTSSNYPMIISSNSLGASPTSLPFLNLKKGECGYGVSTANDRFNVYSWARPMPTENYGKIPIRSTIYSFGGGNKTGYVVNVGGGGRAIITSTFCNMNNGSRNSQNFNSENYFEGLKGGVFSSTTQRHGNLVFDYNTFNRVIQTAVNLAPQMGIITKYGELNDLFGYNNYRSNNGENYGSLSYFESNTNRNNNATWLMKQKTQYQRKFNPLKNLGV